ncbi:MAG TPA: prenyltransferase, partial [Firmicutes bacterium]|nr:prenyltransferase [Bacillota bacterium]
MNVLKKWKIILDTANAPEGEPLDFISKWLVATRAAVVSMTVFSALIGGLLAATAGFFNAVNMALVLIALVL